MNILIIRVSAIGDVVHTLPAIFLLKTLYPHARISWVVQEKAAGLLMHQPFLEHVWVLPNRFLHPRHWHTTWKAVSEMRTQKWDAIIDFQGILKSLILLLPLKGPKYGFDRHCARLGFTSYFTHHHVHYKEIHNIIQKNMSLAGNNQLRAYARQRGYLSSEYEASSPTVSSLKNKLFLEVPQSYQEMVDAWLCQHRITSFVALSPNTTWKSKHWPLSYWQQFVCSVCQTLNNHAIVLIGSSFGKHADELERFAAQHNIPIHVAPAWDLITTTHLLRRADALVAPDTGLLHLADFLGTKTIGLFGPTLAKRHGPFLSEINVANCIQVECSHAYQKVHGKNATEDCMSRLKPETLLHKLHAMLGYPLPRGTRMSIK